MLLFMDGAITLGFVAISLFFLKFWRSTQDSLFAAFSLSAMLLALNQLLLATSTLLEEESAWLYLPRLGAFVVIAFAMLQKNVGTKRGTE